MNIAVVDSHSFVRTSIEMLLRNEFEEATILGADDVPAICDKHGETDIDLFIIGIKEPAAFSFPSHMHLLRSSFPNARIMIYDEKPAPAKVLKYMKSGIQGYLAPLENASDIKNCVSDILNGKKHFSSEIFTHVLDHLISQEKSHSNRKIPELTGREYIIATYLMEGMKTSMIAEKLERKMSTISTIKSKIYQKLGVDNIVKLREVMQPKTIGQEV